MTYTTKFFTDEHKTYLGNISEVDYHKMAEKYTTSIEIQPMDISAPTFQVDLESALKKTDKVFVSGVMTTTPDGDMEDQEMFKVLFNCVKLATSGVSGKWYIHILGANITPYPHPKLLKSLEEKKYALEGGFWAPGQLMPEQCIIVDTRAETAKYTTCLMCSVYSNFKQVKTEGITASHLGCNPDIVPSVAMNVKFLSAEQVIQLAKPQAALGLPEKYMEFEASEANIEKAEAGFDKLKDTKTLKRKSEGSKTERIADHCQAVYDVLVLENDFRTQKKAGQLPLLTGAWFAKAQGTAIQEFSNFNKSNLSKLGANTIMQAFVILLRVHGGDEALYDRLLFDLESNNVPIESAMHDPVKAAKPAEGASKFLFCGLYPDRVWGSLCGCPRFVVQPDCLVHSDGKPQTRHLGNGAELVRQAIRGDEDVLAFFGMDSALTMDNMKAGAAAAYNKFWAMVRDA
jgi:hypothetical protein